MKKANLFISLLAIPLLSGCTVRVKMPVYADADSYLVGSRNYEGSLTSIDIDYICGEVTLIEDSSVNLISVNEDSTLLKEEEQIRSKFEDGKLSIKFMKSGHIARLNTKDKKLTLTYNPVVLKDALIRLTSGELKANSITARETVKIDFTSGDASISSIRTSALSVKHTSGNFSLNELYAVNASFNHTSGNINISASSVNKLNCAATSGSVNIIFKTLSEGNISLTSGSIDVTLPNNEGGKVYPKVTSGKVKSERECLIEHNAYIYGDGEDYSLDLTVTSGSITIK